MPHYVEAFGDKNLVVSVDRTFVESENQIFAVSSARIIFFSEAATWAGPAAAIVVRCDIHVMVADPTYTQPPLKHCTPSCSRAAARLWTAASMGAQRDLLVLVVDLVSAKLQPEHCAPSCSGAAARL